MISLIISDHLDWTDPKHHLKILRAKVETYLSCLESGEFYERYPDAKGSQISVELMLYYNPGPQGDACLSKIKSMVENAGFGFRLNLVAATPFEN